jgi:hypothetical protein
MVLETASPKSDFDDATFERSAASFDNPIMSASLFTIIPGGSAWPKESDSTTILNGALPQAR